MYVGWWLAGRPSVEELRRDIRVVRARLTDYAHAAWNTPAVKAVRVPAACWDEQTAVKPWRTVGRGRGRVAWFAAGRGLIHSEQGEDLVVHFSGIPGRGDRGLSPGDQVAFEIAQGPHGRHAVGVRLIET